MIGPYPFVLSDVELAPNVPRARPRHRAVYLPRRDPFEYYDRLRRVREHVDAHLDQHFDLASAAAAIPMTPHSFGRFFRTHVGLTFREWLTARRLDQAADLLRDHNESVTRVSELVGFATDRTFRRLFHERFGCCPSEFRHRERLERSSPVR